MKQLKHRKKMLSLKLYNLFVYIALPFAYLRLLWRSRLAPAYRKRLAERFAHYKNDYQTNGIVLHAVSVGEANAAVPVIKHLLNKGELLTVTTTTPTGSARVQALFANQIQHVYLPYDHPMAMNRFLDKFKPKQFIVMETEWWPNLFSGLKQRKVPLFIANARLSEKSMRGYLRFRKMSKMMADCITHLAAQTKEDAQRFAKLGVAQDKITVTGNIKFDMLHDQGMAQRSKELKQTFLSRPVWIAASTHAGEEQAIIDAVHIIKKKIPNTLTIVVPRHPERFQAFYQKCQKEKLNIARRSKNETVNAETDIYLGDTMGELMLLYATGDVAFVAGSLANIGGHNVLEPAALGLPIITGPHVFNFADIVKQLGRAGGLIIVDDALALAEQVISWLRDPTHAKLAGQHAQQVLTENRGAITRLLALLAEQ
jgi:3-deoxy-D-manno-octulosonic-acid transferase